MILEDVLIGVCDKCGAGSVHASVLRRVAEVGRGTTVSERTVEWVMALYMDGSEYLRFGSPNLNEWTKLSDDPLPGCGECPDFFELPVDGDAAKSKWRFWGGNGSYRLGTFDGTTFKPENESLKSCRGANDYAAETYSDIRRPTVAASRSRGWRAASRSTVRSGCTFLVDRTSIEIYANDGRVAMCTCFLPNPLNRSLGLVPRAARRRSSRSIPGNST